MHCERFLTKQGEQVTLLFYMARFHYDLSTWRFSTIISTPFEYIFPGKSLGLFLVCTHRRIPSRRAVEALHWRDSQPAPASTSQDGRARFALPPTRFFRSLSVHPVTQLPSSLFLDLYIFLQNSLVPPFRAYLQEMELNFSA